MLDPSNITYVGVGMSAFVATLMATFMLSVAFKDRAMRYWGYSILFFGSWAWISFASHFVDTESTVRQIMIGAIIAQVIAQVFLVYFIFAYLEEIRPLKKLENIWRRLLEGAHYLIIGFLIIDLSGTNLMIGEHLSAHTGTPGTFLLFFVGVWYVLALTAGYILSRRTVIEKDTKSRRAGITLTIGLTVALLFGGCGVIMWYYDHELLALFRVLALPFYTATIMYAIVTHRLFNLRVAAAEAFVFAIWSAVFLRALLQPTLAEAIPDLLILLSVIVLGFFLIRNVKKELETKIELENVSDKLQTLNRSLEDKVEERTIDLEKARRHTEQLVEYMPVGIIEIGPNQQIIRINQTAETILNLNQKVLKNTRLADHDVIVDIVGTKLTTGVFERQTKDKEPHDLEVIITPLSLEQSEGYVIVLHDITERRELERSKNEFIATAAHQLRTPLSAIKWTFELLETEKLSKKTKEILAQGKQGTVNLERIAETLMMSISTSERTDDYLFTDTDIRPILDDLLQMTQALADKRKISLENEISPALPTLHVNIKRIGFAFQNLLDNAIRYTPEGGRVVLTAKQQNDSVVITVSDTGIGISATDQKQLFKKFFRSESATKMSTDGSGLGLFITKNVVEEHGGTITMSSKEGAGTTFIVTLPVPTKQK
ncbi:MAG: ATP-binding protein [Candidatus Paceibacterota bacterium]